MRRVTLVALAAVGLTACGGGQAAPKASPTTVTNAAPVTTATVPPPTSTPPPTTTTQPPPPTTPLSTSTTFPTYALSGYGATIVAWDKFHCSSDGKYHGFAAYGPIISTPGGPTPQFIAVLNDGTNIISFNEGLPDGTSLASAKQIALESLPFDTVPQSFDVSYQNGSCRFWNLTSQTLATAGQGGADGSVSIEMAYDDSNGFPHYEPNDINTLSFEMGINDSSGTC